MMGFVGMRTDCRHYVRRTSVAGEVVEACRIDAAPDAPYSCPDNCPLFEKVTVSRAGWTIGSLGAPEPSANTRPPEDADELFASLETDFDPSLVARIEAEEAQRRKGGRWWKRKRK